MVFFEQEVLGAVSIISDNIANAQVTNTYEFVFYVFFLIWCVDDMCQVGTGARSEKIRTYNYKVRPWSVDHVVF